VGCLPRRIGQLKWEELMNRLSLISALAVSLLPSFALAEPISRDVAARTELHSIDTLTLSDAQTQRIALMGFSRGGQAALYASLKRFHKMWNRSGIEFAAYIPFYPDCATTFISDTDVADHPIRIFGGTRDDYNPIALCKAYVERLKAAGRDVQLTEYPDAPHAFDNPLGPVPAAVVTNGQTVRHCVIREEPAGLLINVSTQQPFTYKDPCVELNPHVGHDAAATETAKTSVKAILKTVLKL
jgi:dienelactone hydrolase